MGTGEPSVSALLSASLVQHEDTDPAFWPGCGIYCRMPEGLGKIRSDLQGESILRTELYSKFNVPCRCSKLVCPLLYTMHCEQCIFLSGYGTNLGRLYSF
jgi:hypothetical protein